MFRSTSGQIFKYVSVSFNTLIEVNLWDLSSVALLSFWVAGQLKTSLYRQYLNHIFLIRHTLIQQIDSFIFPRSFTYLSNLAHGVILQAGAFIWMHTNCHNILSDWYTTGKILNKTINIYLHHLEAIFSIKCVRKPTNFKITH